MSQRRRVPLAVLLLWGCAEGGAPDPGVARRDSAGVEIVEHASLAGGGALALSAEPEVRIEGDERITPFDRIAAVAMLGDGTVLVADGGAQQVHAFSADGAYAWSAGREGDGPGEFRRIVRLFVTAGDSILVADGGLARLTLFDSAGTFVRDERFEEGVGAPAAVLRDGARLYLREERQGEPSVGVHPTRATWSSVGPADEPVRTLTTTDGTDSYYGQAGDRRVVVRPDFLRHLHVAPVGDGFAVALSDRPAVDVFGPAGRHRRSVRLPEAALSEEVADPDAVREGLLAEVPPPMRDGFAELVAGLPVPGRWPPIGALIGDDADRLWVAQYRPRGRHDTPWYVFAADGAYVGRVVAPAGFTPRAVRGGRIAGVWRDDMDVESVRLYATRGR